MILSHKKFVSAGLPGNESRTLSLLSSISIISSAHLSHSIVNGISVIVAGSVDLIFARVIVGASVSLSCIAFFTLANSIIVSLLEHIASVFDGVVQIVSRLISRLSSTVFSIGSFFEACSILFISALTKPIFVAAFDALLTFVLSDTHKIVGKEVTDLFLPNPNKPDIF